MIKKLRTFLPFIVALVLAGIIIVGLAIFDTLQPKLSTTPNDESISGDIHEIPKYYSSLTGEEISDGSLNSSPTYCVQIPNGADGARPHVGLTQAGVVFEAIAEAGITRFAAIFQNPTASAIGPIRSLRTYYLQWDTPFDCTIVHAGGSDDALAALRAGGYRDLTESLVYMWRDYSGYWAPNNLFTSANLLQAYSTDHGYTASKVAGFPRLKPDEASEIAAANVKNSTSQNISINFGYVATFNTNYVYDATTNSYLRSYADGQPHLSYSCPDTTKPRPKNDCGEPIQVAPKAVAVMVVNQSTAWDNYHQDIQAIGSGEAYVFQNGEAVHGSWTKSSINSQIVFKDSAGNEIAFTPGQLWIAAIPKSVGSVEY